MGNLVAIVGRPNVGKSTLFNRLTNSRRAIVSDEAGTTRDRQYGKCEWSKLPVVLVANKADDGKDLYGQYEFYKLGLGDPFCVSAATGSGTGDLLDHILTKLKSDEVDDIEDGTPRFAVVGRPNAGKSSIINAFIGEDRNIVTEIAGTTRDSIYTKYDKFGFDFYLVDTAGIRRKNKVTEERIPTSVF